MPRDPDRVVGALLHALRCAHELEHLALQYALTIRRGSVTHVEARVGEKVGDAEADSACCDARRGHERPLKRRRPVARGMSRREALDNELTRRRSSVFEAERLKYEI